MIQLFALVIQMEALLYIRPIYVLLIKSVVETLVLSIMIFLF